MTPTPRVIVCVGGGGVGKTSTSAALAIALARGGARALIVTIDPARRLAGAMGVELSDAVTPVPMEGLRGSLSALMPDPRLSAGTFVDILFAEDPAARARVLSNRLYQGLADAAAGVHEIVAMSLIAHASETGLYDVIVIDTAPSRNAIDFVTYPSRLAGLLGGKVVTFFAGLSGGSAPPRRRGLLSRMGGRVESLLEKVVGPNLLSDTAALFADLALVRPRFVELTERASELLLGPRVTYLLVSAPTAAARDDAVFLKTRIEGLGHRPRAILLNRATASEGDWLDDLRDHGETDPGLDAITELLRDELIARRRATAEATEDLSRRLKGLPILPLPVIESPAPELIVAALADALEGYLRILAQGD